jgi:hypothetical protein
VLGLGGLLIITSVSGCTETESSSDVKFEQRQQLPPGTETHLCQLVQIPSSADGEIFVSGRTHAWTTGGHHYGLYRTTLDKLPSGVELNQSELCWGGANSLMQYATDFITLEQTAQATVDFPEGVALPFKSGEILLMQLHALNPSDAPLDVTVDVTLRTIKKSQVKQRMGLLQFYDPYIYLSAHAGSQANLRCEIPNDLTMIEANPHFHARGVDHQSFLDPPSGPRATVPFLHNTDWEHPIRWQGTMALPAGSHIRFRCKYQNFEDRFYIQGQDVYDNEMCSFWAYVYPAPEDRTAMDCIGTHVSEYGVGTKSCAATTDCIRACPPGDSPDLSTPGLFTVGPCYQQCIVNSCPSAGALLDRQEQCAAANCPAECPGAGCQACVAAKCQAEAAACQSASSCE